MEKYNKDVKNLSHLYEDIADAIQTTDNEFESLFKAAQHVVDSYGSGTIIEFKAIQNLKAALRQIHTSRQTPSPNFNPQKGDSWGWED